MRPDDLSQLINCDFSDLFFCLPLTNPSDLNRYIVCETHKKEIYEYQ